MKSYLFFIILVLFVFLMAMAYFWRPTRPAASKNADIHEVWPGAKIPMPGEVFSPAYRQHQLQQKETFEKNGGFKRAEEYLQTPAAAWQERIPMRSCIGYLGAEEITAQDTKAFNATCPACLRPLRFGKVDIYDGTVMGLCCGTVFYENPARYPAGAPGKPNKVMKIPHLDGQVVEYNYYEFPDHFANYEHFHYWQPWSPADGSKRHEIFLPDGYIRGHRMTRINTMVIPDLGWAYFYTGDEKYAKLLAAMFDRLADVYRGWPLWMPYTGRWGFALNRAGNGVLTKEEFDSAERPMRWGAQFWNDEERFSRMGQTKLGAYLHTADMRWVVAPLVKAYAAVRGSQALREYSRQKYGDPEKLDRHVMQDLFGEMAKLHKCYEPWLGNYTPSWFEGGILLSLLTQDRYFFDVANELMERMLYDGSHSDHTPTEGSCAYWSMAFGSTLSAFQLREMLSDPEVKKRHPRLTYFSTADALQKRMASWRGIIPAFGDAWNDLYPTLQIKPEPKNPDEFASFHLPDYGVSMLRWGKAEGRRQETCLVYQRHAGHCHNDALNIEYFVDGLPVFWEMGYGNGTIDTSIQRHPEMRELVVTNWPRPVFDTGPYYQNGKGKIPAQHWWGGEWNPFAPAHCTVMVDDQEPTQPWKRAGAGIPVTIFSESGGKTGQRLLEVLDVEERGAFKPDLPYVNQFRRTLLTVETPAGGGYLVDIFRVAGGKMHEFYYHAISEKSASSLPEGEAMPGTLANYRERTLSQKERMKEIDNPASLQTTEWARGYRHINALKRISQEPETWQLEWEYDPALYAPRTIPVKSKPPPVTLAIHGVRQHGTEQQAWVWRARGLLTGHLRENLKDGTQLDGGWRSCVGFVGGLDMLILERRADKDLKSVFVHVLEGRRSGLAAEVTAVSNLKCADIPEGAVALKVQLADGHTDYLFALAEPAEVRTDDISFNGRYGLVRVDKTGKVVQAVMIRGSELKYKDFVLNGRAEHEGTIQRLEGDITGDRQHPAIIMQTDQTLPEGAILAGYPVNLTAPDGWTDVFFIDSITAIARGVYRIALRGHPTFIIDFLTVGNADDKDPYAFFPKEKDLSKSFLDALYECNTILMTLKDGKRYPVDVTAPSPYATHSARVALRDKTVPFKESGLHSGDQAILLRYQPGDRVTIPLHVEMP